MWHQVSGLQESQAKCTGDLQVKESEVHSNHLQLCTLPDLR